MRCIRVITALAMLGVLLPFTQTTKAAEVSDQLAFEQPAGAVARVEVTYPNRAGACPAKTAKPLRARYRGRLDVVQTSDGRLAIVDSLTFPEYLQGLAEVPRSWPEAALQAQVIAARSYALYQLAHRRPSGATLGYDICSTDRCQVYRGVAIEQGAFGERWIAAVEATRGQALVYEGEPIQAFYFSTSSGRTRSNKEVFGGEALPYLPSVPGEDADAPLAKWTVRIPLADLQRILAAGGVGARGTLRGAERRGDDVVLDGSGGGRQISATAFRRALNNEAACLIPDRYPARRADGSKLPQTVPSIRFGMATRDGAAVLEGRGWGHDVGMSQYGAKSLASRGRSAADILAHYYGGLRPQSVTEPGAIRVLVAEGAIAIKITPEGGGTLNTGNGGQIGSSPAYEIVPGPLGRATIRRVTAGGLQPVLEITEVSSTRRPQAVEQVFRLSAAARVAVTVQRGGVTAATVAEASFERGENRIVVPLTDQNGTALPPGDYDVTLEAFDGIDRVRLTSRVMIEPKARPAGPNRDRPSSRTPLIGVAAGALLAMCGAALLMLRRQR